MLPCLVLIKFSSSGVIEGPQGLQGLWSQQVLGVASYFATFISREDLGNLCFHSQLQYLHLLKDIINA